RHTSGTQLYLYENGVSKPILDTSAATYFASEFFIPGFYFHDLASTTADGSKLLFLDRANLNPYNTEDPACAAINAGHGLENGHCAEAYVYNASNGSVVCVSCNPNGTPPVSSAELFEVQTQGQSAGVGSPFISPEMQNISINGSRVFF